MTDQYRVNKPVAKRISDDSSSEQISARHVYSPYISNTPIDSTVPPDPIANTVLLMPNCAALTSTSNGYNNIHSSESDDEPVFKEMVDSKSINPINTYIVVPPNLTLVITPPKVLNKQRKIRGRKRITTINQAKYDKTASDRFLSTALHSVSQSITHANSHRIAIYNNKETACCGDSGASEDMFPYYYTFKTYHRLSNCYATLCDTTRLPIEEICTTVYTLNGHTILTRNALHIPALRGPLYSLCKHCKRPGCGVYS